MAGLDYVAGNFSKAVDLLATSASDLRTRILQAVIPDLNSFRADDFPNKIDRADYESMREKRRREDGAAASMEENLAAMGEEECEEVARLIRKLEVSLRRQVSQK
jgi:hypothetical protein